jgi:hypothetical protein
VLRAAGVRMQHALRAERVNSMCAPPRASNVAAACCDESMSVTAIPLRINASTSFGTGQLTCASSA